MAFVECGALCGLFCVATMLTPALLAGSFQVKETALAGLLVFMLGAPRALCGLFPGERGIHLVCMASMAAEIVLAAHLFPAPDSYGAIGLCGVGFIYLLLNIPDQKLKDD
jgi:hypothetical protein